jgi:hypothetical protein
MQKIASSENQHKHDFKFLILLPRFSDLYSRLHGNDIIYNTVIVANLKRCLSELAL